MYNLYVTHIIYNTEQIITGFNTMEEACSYVDMYYDDEFQYYITIDGHEDI